MAVTPELLQASIESARMEICMDYQRKIEEMRQGFLEQMGMASKAIDEAKAAAARTSAELAVAI